MTAAEPTELEEHLRSRMARGRALFVPYLTAGLPSPQGFVELVADLASSADAVEVGVPFSDPIMDGPVISEALGRALEAGVTVERCFGLLREARRHAGVPVVAMTYYNPVHRMGAEAFAKGLGEAGAAGVIVPDLPLEESGELAPALAARGMAQVLLVAPTTPAGRAALLARRSAGFLYAVARLGVTGARDSLDEAARAVVRRVRPFARVPVLLGIGIGDAGQARTAAGIADGVIVGSAIMRRVLAGDAAGAAALAREIRAALDGTGNDGR